MRTRSRRTAQFFRQWSYLVIRAQQPCFDMPESGKLDSPLGYLRSWLNLCLGVAQGSEEEASSGYASQFLKRTNP